MMVWYSRLYKYNKMSLHMGPVTKVYVRMNVEGPLPAAWIQENVKITIQNSCMSLKHLSLSKY
jgi:hypothetical protein